ncbi:MAG: thiamine pyrophosphate-dependent enzyme [Patescibacteria group bacterium]|nr:2-oxoacid:ferredoxin oxidoreductase subunit beta [Patescibacteria group bacterium]
MAQLEDFNTTVTPTWCPGCGNYGIWNSLKQALSEMELEPYNTVLTYDIGCSGNMADKVNTYGFKSLHGRTVAAAMGIKIANPELTVIAIGGDGGVMEEGVNHLMWAARSNYNITVLMHNNQTFGLTTGQPTVTTEEGNPGKTAPLGIVENNIVPAQLALISNASFVAKTFAGNPKQMVKVMKSAVEHKGFSFVEFLQPCITFNKLNTFQWFQERVFDLAERKNYDASDWKRAFETASDVEKKIATGIIYQDKKSIPYSQRLVQRKGEKKTLVEEVKEYSIIQMIREFE